MEDRKIDLDELLQCRVASFQFEETHDVSFDHLALEPLQLLSGHSTGSATMIKFVGREEDARLKVQIEKFPPPVEITLVK